MCIPFRFETKHKLRGTHTHIPSLGGGTVDYLRRLVGNRWGSKIPARILLLKGRCRTLQSGGLVFPLSYYVIFKELRQIVAFFVGNVEGFSPHSCRRGGATWLFQVVGSYDQVMVRGKWAQLGAAKLYMDTALGDLVGLP